MNYFFQKYLYKHRFIFGLGFLFLVWNNYLIILIPLKVKQIIDCFMQNTSMSFVEKTVFLKAMILSIVVFSLMMFIVRTLSRLCLFYPARQIEYEVRGDLNHLLLNMTRSFYKSYSKGEMISIAMNDTKNIRSMFALGCLHTANSIIIFIFVNYQIYLISPRLMFCISIPIPLLLWISFYFYSKLNSLVDENQKRLGEMTHVIMNSFEDVLVVKSFAVESNFKKIFDEQNRLYSQGILKIAKFRSYLFPFIGVIGSIGQVILFVVGGRMIVDGTMSLGSFIAVSAYLYTLVWPIIAFSWIFSLIQMGHISLRRIIKLFKTLESFQRDHCMSRLKSQKSSIGPNIEVKNMSCRFFDKPFLKNISFTIKSGEIVGIFAPTGSGKTLLLNMIAGIEKNPSNSIFVDGVSLEKYSKANYWSHLAYIPQNPFLFSQSIANNIAYSDIENMNKEYQKEKIQQMVHLASLNREIERLTHQYDSVIGHMGLQVSVGQKNRLALARAFYKGYSLLVVDDIFASFDNDTVLSVFHGILTYQSNATKIIATHNMSVLSRCEKVIVFKEGVVVQQGIHSELIQEKGLYRDMFLYQNSLDGSS